LEPEQHVVDQGGQTLALGMVNKLITLEQRRRRVWETTQKNQTQNDDNELKLAIVNFDVCKLKILVKSYGLSVHRGQLLWTS
jgi:hypothetical protein